jgi:hypothetical protein
LQPRRSCRRAPHSSLGRQQTRYGNLAQTGSCGARNGADRTAPPPAHERHGGVAGKVIATVDDLDRIADDDHADVPALSGWRRELFGEKALALKRGQLSLAIEKGRGVVERS